MNKTFWDGKPWQAFKNFAIIFSFVVNFILILVLVIAAPLIIPIVNDIVEPIVGGLNQSFVDMNEASIVQTIEVDDTLPIAFTLPLEQETTVVLVEPVPLQVDASFVLPAGGGTINGTVFIELPEGLPLPVALNLEVPVEQTIPVQLSVPVNIVLQETDLGTPFNRLESLFGPLNQMLGDLPSSNEELIGRIIGSLDNPNEPVSVAR